MAWLRQNGSVLAALGGLLMAVGSGFAGLYVRAALADVRVAAADANSRIAVLEEHKQSDARDFDKIDKRLDRMDAKLDRIIERLP